MTLDRSEGDVNLSPRRRAWQEAHLDHETRSLLARDERVFLRQSLSTPCVNAVRGAAGPWIEDERGARYLDFHGNSVHQVGFGHPAVIEAVVRELERLPFCSRRYTNRRAIELAERLAEFTPGSLGKCLFAPGGSLAIGIALKLARAATGRHKTVSFRGAFHGASLDAAAVGGESLFHDRMGPLMPGALHVPPPDGDAEASLREIERVLEEEGDVAAVVAEPVRATTVSVPPAWFWQRVRDACDRHGTLLIFDEIPTALGRTGRMFACEHSAVVPDVLVLGKGLGGGVMPIAAVVARPELDVAPELALGHYTHEKSPLGAAAALATLGVIEREGLVQRSASLGDASLSRLRELTAGVASVEICRGLGLMLGVVHRAPADGPGPEEVAERVMYESLSHGLSYKVGGGRVATLFPPLNIAETELEGALETFAAACVGATRVP